MKSQTAWIVASLGLMLSLAVLPQHGAQAKASYGSSKDPTPYPPSNYVMDRQARKAASLSSTPAPTDTPVPAATATPQASALAAQPVAAACPAPAAGAAPGPAIAPPSNPRGSSLFPWIVDGGALLGGLLIGLFMPGIVRQFAGHRYRQKETVYDESLVDNYAYPELHSKSHDELKESITVRSEKHTLQ